MSNFLKYSLIGGGVAISLLVVALLIKKRRPKNGQPQNPSPNTSTGGNTSASGVFPLKRGSQGEEVKFIQRILNENFNAGLPVNGNFDSSTEAALVDAQNSFKVRMALRSYGTPSGYRVGEVSQGLYDLLKQYA